MAKATGKWLESKLQAGLVDLQKRNPLRWLRLYDSTSAGLNAGNSNYLPEQDGDFILICNGGQGCLIECKESTVHGSLRSWLASAVSTNQRAAHRFWHRAGAATIFLHYSQCSHELEVWWGWDVVVARNEGIPLNRSQALLVATVDPKHVEAHIINVYETIVALQNSGRIKK